MSAAGFSSQGTDAGIARTRDRLHRGVEEDREMVNSLQSGMNSRLFEPGPLSRMELNLHSLLNYYLDRIGFGG